MIIYFFKDRSKERPYFVKVLIPSSSCTERPFFFFCCFIVIISIQSIAV